MKNRNTTPVYAGLRRISALGALGLALLALSVAGVLWSLTHGNGGPWLTILATTLTATGCLLSIFSAWRASSQLLERRETAQRLTELMAGRQSAESLAVIGSWMFNTTQSKVHLSDWALKILHLPP